MSGRATPRLRTLLALGLAVAAAACARFDSLGRPPTMTPPGAQKPVVAPLAAERAAIARAPARPPAEAYAVASTWRSGPQSLFGDRRARDVGDILTIVVEIDDGAVIRNTTARSRSGQEDLSVTALFGLPGVAARILPGGGTLDPAVGAASGSSSSGDGRTQRTEEITLRVAATVVDVLPNGHLVISGSQEIRVNFELRDLQVAGIVRPEDISRRNEIGYDKIADARIAYGGRGQITDLQQPRIGQQIADIVLPF